MREELPAALHEGCTMGDLILRAVRRGGEHIAFVLDEQAISYREFGAQLSRMVQALEARGLRHGDPIAVLSSNRPEAILVNAAGYLMGLRATWMHPLASEDDHAYLLEDSGVTTLFVDSGTFAERAASLRVRVPGLERVFGLGPNDFGEDILAASAAFTPGALESKAHADDICVLIYTGGTTGKPKGVIHSHRVPGDDGHDRARRLGLAAGGAVSRHDADHARGGRDDCRGDDARRHLRDVEGFRSTTLFRPRRAPSDHGDLSGADDGVRPARRIRGSRRPT